MIENISSQADPELVALIEHLDYLHSERRCLETYIVMHQDYFEACLDEYQDPPTPAAARISLACAAQHAAILAELRVRVAQYRQAEAETRGLP
jgi:hypothetical protein